jgi:hypothetical protein
MRNGVRREWTGDYVTDDDALAALQKECDDALPVTRSRKRLMSSVTTVGKSG